MTLFPLVVEQLKAQGAATSCFSAAGPFRPKTPKSSRTWAFEKSLRPGAPLAANHRLRRSANAAVAANWSANASPVRTRVAPSPTGDPHVGTAYVALVNYCFAKQHGGEFVLRIEDTDRARSTPKAKARFSMRCIGADWHGTKAPTSAGLTVRTGRASARPFIAATSTSCSKPDMPSSAFARRNDWKKCAWRSAPPASRRVTTGFV